MLINSILTIGTWETIQRWLNWGKLWKFWVFLKKFRKIWSFNSNEVSKRNFTFIMPLFARYALYERYIKLLPFDLSQFTLTFQKFGNITTTTCNKFVIASGGLQETGKLSTTKILLLRGKHRILNCRATTILLDWRKAYEKTFQLD